MTQHSNLSADQNMPLIDEVFDVLQEGGWYIARFEQSLKTLPYFQKETIIINQKESLLLHKVVAWREQQDRTMLRLLDMIERREARGMSRG